MAIRFNFLLGLELRQLGHIFPPQHGPILIKLNPVGALQGVHNLLDLGIAHFLNLVAVEETLHINKMILIGGDLVVEKLVALEVLVAQVVADLFC